MGKKAGPPPLLPRPPACLALLAKDNTDNADKDKVAGEEAKSIQRRLREQLNQVWDENATFQRLMYKNRNQHRRAIYFHRLSQVRRDLLLLQSLGLSDVVESLVQWVTPGKQKAAPAKAAMLNNMLQGVESKEQLRYAAQRRLLGAARLLEKMADPILNASSQIAGLLSQSFFMPFALTTLALLARFRVLLLQVLYEVVAAYNLVAATAQQMQSLAVSKNVPVFLECRWDGVKLDLREKMDPPPPSPSPGQLLPLPLFVSDETPLPAVGWFIDDRSTISKAKLLSTGSDLVLYEREEGLLLGASPFELLGDEDNATNTVNVPTEAARIQTLRTNTLSQANAKRRQDDNETPAELTLLKRKWTEGAVSGGEPPVEDNHPSSKKRVAYISIQLGAPKVDSLSAAGARTHGPDRVETRSSSVEGSLPVVKVSPDAAALAKLTYRSEVLTEPITLRNVKGTPDRTESIKLSETAIGVVGTGSGFRSEELVPSCNTDACAVKEGSSAQVPVEDGVDAVPLEEPEEAGLVDAVGAVRQELNSNGALEASAVAANWERMAEDVRVDAPANTPGPCKGREESAPGSEATGARQSSETTSNSDPMELQTQIDGPGGADFEPQSESERIHQSGSPQDPVDKTFLTATTLEAEDKCKTTVDLRAVDFEGSEGQCTVPASSLQGGPEPNSEIAHYCARSKLVGSLLSEIDPGDPMQTTRPSDIDTGGDHRVPESAEPAPSAGPQEVVEMLLIRSGTSDHGAVGIKEIAAVAAGSDTPMVDDECALDSGGRVRTARDSDLVVATTASTFASTSWVAGHLTTEDTTTLPLTLESVVAKHETRAIETSLATEVLNPVSELCKEAGGRALERTAATPSIATAMRDEQEGPETTGEGTTPQSSQRSNSEPRIVKGAEGSGKGKTLQSNQQLNSESRSTKGASWLDEIDDPSHKRTLLGSKKSKKAKRNALKLAEGATVKVPTPMKAVGLPLGAPKLGPKTPGVATRPGTETVTGQPRKGKSPPEGEGAKDPALKRMKMDDIFDMLLGN